ncbi:MAG: GAF domain-containing sensor histidine kinase [Casimicrobiaceae bacterium]
MRSSARESSWHWVAGGVDALAAARDTDTVLATLAQVAVAHLADCCIVFAKRKSGGLELATSRHRDPAQDALAQDFARRYPVTEDAGTGAAFVVRTGQSELLPIVPNADSVARAAGSGRHALDVLRAFAMHSALAVPLKAGAETIGAIVLTRSESELPFNADDLAVAETLARIGGWSLAHMHRTQQSHGVSGSAHMLSVASHEVMNCLGVLGMSAAILLRTGELDPTVRAKHLKVIDRDTKHLARLSRELIDIAKLYSGPLALNREPQNAAALLRDAADSMKNRASPGGIIVAADSTELNVRADRERILQVLSTLLTYATEHASAPYSIPVSAVASADQVHIAVADEQSQLSDAMFSLLSDPLHCIGRTDHRELGLQLFICQEIIAAHGGRLWIERIAARGYKFCFTLPLAA